MVAKKKKNGAARQDYVGKGGETHQTASDPQARITTNHGTPVGDNQNSLKAGSRGPSLLEDFILREKIQHFDHERIPERIVHARGSGAHGYFQLKKSLAKHSRAKILTQVGEKTEVFVRFSTVAGGAGSVDTPRDVRGFAVKFYTKEGNWDLVGNNIPVFFIQDAIKFPDLIHAVKMEADRGYPQAASAHDTFWDFVGLMPESTHMIMWAMSDRTIPRSLRMIEGFGVNTFRLLNDKDEATFVKFHWRPKLGLQSTCWDEAVKLAGADPDYHRRDLFEAIERGDFPEWDFGVQLLTQEEADALPFDILDATKVIPEELFPLQIIGTMVLDRNPANFFAETEQAAFLPTNMPPGIDVSEDPLLQGRLFSYQDTQLSRLGTVNFQQIPINQPKGCPFQNFQRDGQMQTLVFEGRANDYRYFPEPDLLPVAPVRRADRGAARRAARAARRATPPAEDRVGLQPTSSSRTSSTAACSPRSRRRSRRARHRPPRASGGRARSRASRTRRVARRPISSRRRTSPRCRASIDAGTLTDKLARQVLEGVIRARARRRRSSTRAVSRSSRTTARSSPRSTRHSPRSPTCSRRSATARCRRPARSSAPS